MSATLYLFYNINDANVLKVFRAKDANGNKIVDENIVKVNDVVVVQGKLQKYVKNDVVTPELVKAHFLSYNASSINNITADKLKNGAIYNVAGQQVTESYKGLVIKNGKKFVIK